MQKLQTSSDRSASQPFFGQQGPAQPEGPVIKSSSSGPARTPGKPFFGSEGPADTIPPTKQSNAAAQQPPTQASKPAAQPQGGRTAGQAFFGQAAPAQPEGPVIDTSSSGPARTPGQPFFGQEGPAQPEGPVLDTSNSGPARTPGTAFFAKGGGAENPGSVPPPTQTLKVQQAAARNRAQKPSGKTPDAKPVFKVHSALRVVLLDCWQLIDLLQADLA